MATTEKIKKVEGSLTTVTKASNPVQCASAVTATVDGELATSTRVSVSYGQSSESFTVFRQQLGLLIDALLEHEAATEGRLAKALTIADVEARRVALREERLAMKEASND